MRSLFIAVDGIDGCGKTTQTENIAHFFYEKKFPYIITKEPGGTEVGLILRQILTSSRYHVENITEILLYSADRLEHQKKIVLPNLEKGFNVISDRFVSSTYAYQVFGRGIEKNTMDFLRDLTVFKYPDVLFFIDIDPEIALSRAKKRLIKTNNFEKEGKFESLSLDFFEKVRAGFIWYAATFPNVITIDGSKNSEEVFDDIKKKLEGMIY